MYRGERPLVKDNCNLKKDFKVEVSLRPAGKAPVDVTFQINASGLLTVTCVEPTSGQQLQSVALRLFS